MPVLLNYSEVVHAVSNDEACVSAQRLLYGIVRMHGHLVQRGKNSSTLHAPCMPHSRLASTPRHQCVVPHAAVFPFLVCGRPL